MPAASDAEARAALLHAAVMSMAIVGFAISGRLWILAAVGALSMAEWVRRRLAAAAEPVRMGLANRITGLRVGLVAGIGLYDPERLIPTAGILVFIVFALDGLDGWWARRTKTATTFGAAFDQEADAFLVAMASAALVLADAAPGWVLVCGALRYGYVLVVQGFGLRGEAPRNVIARYVFGTVVTSMGAALCWPGPVTRTGMIVATALLAWSFARSFWWSWRGPVRSKD